MGKPLVIAFVGGFEPLLEQRAAGEPWGFKWRTRHGH